MTAAGITEICEKLAIDRMKARQLVDSGFLGLYEITGSGRVSVERSRLDDVAAWPQVTSPHPSALVIRLANMTPNDDPAWPEREFVGYGASMKSDQLRDSARGWWRVRDPDSWYGHLLAATLVGFVVGTWTIVGHSNGYGARRFDLRPAPKKAGAGRFLNHRLRTGSGGNIAIVEAQDWPNG